MMLKIALVAAPMLLLVPASGAMAQAGGSYRSSCTNINQDGSMLTADCRTPGGQRVTSTIDTQRCGNVGVANSNGRLTCGGVQGSATQGRGRGGYNNSDNGDDNGFQGRQQRQRPRGYDQQRDYGNSYDAPPPPRYDRRPRPPVYGDDQPIQRGGGYYNPDND